MYRIRFSAFLALRSARSAFWLILFVSHFNTISADAADEINFSRDIRPVLSANCYGCHGSDEQHRQGSLRLDTFDGATEVSEVPDRRAAVVPGNPTDSELLNRVRSLGPGSDDATSGFREIVIDRSD